MINVMKKLPDEIINEILIIKGLSDQHEIFINCLKKLSYCAAKFKIKFIEIKYMENLTKNIFADSIEDTILEYTDYEERLWLLKEMINCNCCERHMKRKPNLEQFRKGYVPSYSISVKKDNICSCECRHITRCIFRAQNDEIEN